MTNVHKEGEIYRCQICKNIIEVVYAGQGELICCGEPMERLDTNTTDTDQEKHVPVIEKNKYGYLVKIGSIPHPMEKKHYIMWVELVADGNIYRKYLKPEDKPEAKFCLKAKKVNARIYCNIHGLWAK